MKKTLCILCSMLFINPSVAITVCKKSNTAIAVLNKVVGGTPSVVNNTWSVAMGDGNTVHGKSLCTGMPGAGFAVVNTAVADTEDTGVNCFCKMMRPAASYWVFESEYSSDTACETNCATACANYMAGTASGCKSSVTMDDENNDMCLKFRSAVYESIW